MQGLTVSGPGDLGKQSGMVLSTGGGVVTREENYPLLHQNGILIWLKRDISALATDHRPLSKKRTPAELFAEREPMYRRFADVTVAVTESATGEAAGAEAANRILEILETEE